MGGMGTTGRKLESAKKGRRTVIDHRRRDGRRDGAMKMSLKKFESRFVRKFAPRRFASREPIMDLLLRGAALEARPRESPRVSQTHPELGFPREPHGNPKKTGPLGFSQCCELGFPEENWQFE